MCKPHFAHAYIFQTRPKIKGRVSIETVVLRRWESIAGNLALTTGLKT